jgi:hydroxypyruvate isomerase
VEELMTHTLSYGVNCSILFTELPLLDRPAAAKAAGFGGVEFWWPFATAVPAAAEVDAFVSAIEEAGVRLVGLNLFAGDMPAGDRGLMSWPGREQELHDNLVVVVSIAERLDCRAFNALWGNRVAGADPQAQDELAVENLRHAARAVAPLGGTILVEPISGAPDYPLLSAADALAMIDRVGESNVSLLADLYHLAVNGDDVDRMIAEHTGRIGHVQIADAPGRNEPGTGTLPLQAQLGALQDGGYDGWVCLEYKPSGVSADSFGWISRERDERP